METQLLIFELFTVRLYNKQNYTHIARHDYFKADGISFMKRSIISPIFRLIVFSKPGTDKKQMESKKARDDAWVWVNMYMLPKVISFWDTAVFKCSIQACEEVLGIAVLHIIVQITLPVDVNSNLSSLKQTITTKKSLSLYTTDCQMISNTIISKQSANFRI